ncbi:MAG: TonB-dependent receptor plug domain-containing protein, partial [Sphingobacterium sp.]
MKTFFIFCLMSCLLFCTTYVEAQTSSNTISGIVSGGNPLETLSGVSVMLKGTKIGTVTGSAGKYELTVPTSQGILIFSYIGYEVLEVEINQRTAINANLHASGNALEELVVVGYGTQKRKDLTGSIASVSAEDIKNQPASNIESLLQGRAAGVQINQSSGAPGSNLSVRIRGGSSINAGNEPLYVIDGIPLMNDNQDPSGTSYGTASSTNALTSLNPDDIE